MNSNQEANLKARTTYNAAADSFDAPANSFWDRFGRCTIDRLSLTPGAHVLDVCCGSGASAIPAAEQVGPQGYVLAVDLAERLLELGRAKAQTRGLTNIEFRLGDMLQLGLPEASFDVVVCVFGIFFVPDISRAVRELWRLFAPAGNWPSPPGGHTFLNRPTRPSGRSFAPSDQSSIKVSTPGISSVIRHRFELCWRQEGPK